MKFFLNDNNQSGILEGKILGDAWNSNKGVFDSNRDNIMQYVILQGPHEHANAIYLTKTNLNTFTHFI